MGEDTQGLDSSNDKTDISADVSEKEEKPAKTSAPDKDKEKYWSKLKKEREEKAKARSDARASQVGSGDRSEKIRTYNFPQGRVTDHRINLTLYKIGDVMNGSALDEIVDALITEEQAAKLASLDM